MRSYDLWGAPFDGGATLGWPGARYGPAAIRKNLSWIQGRLENDTVYSLDDASHHNLSNDFLVDRGDVDVIPSDLMASLQAGSTAVADTMRAGRVPLFIGGDDSMLFGAVRGFHNATQGKIGLIYLDAHFDLADTNARQGAFSQSSGMRRCLELDRIDVAASIQVGLRNFNFASSAHYATEIGLEVLSAKSACRMGIEASAEQVLRRVSQADHTFLSIDIDVVDPAFAPGSGAHEPGGFSSRQIIDFVCALAPYCDGLALMEVNPMVDANDTTSRLAATLIFDFAVFGRKRLQLSGDQDAQL